MTGLHVNASDMNLQGMNTIRSSEDLESQINSLNSNVDFLMTIWKGPAASEFKRVTDEEILNLRDFQQLINVLGEKITRGAQYFNDTEDENTSRASNLFY